MRFRYPHSQSIKVYLNVRVRIGRESRPKQLHLGYIGVNDGLDDLKMAGLLRALIERWPRKLKPNAIDWEDAKAKLDRLRSGAVEHSVRNSTVESFIPEVPATEPDVSKSAPSKTAEEATPPEVSSSDAIETQPQFLTTVSYESRSAVNDPVRSAMRRAVETSPEDDTFRHHALPLLTSARAVGAPQDALLIVLQREREAAERQAVRQGLSADWLGESGEGRRTRGSFEADVIEQYLPGFLQKVSSEVSRERRSFALHAHDKYRDRLHQLARRERHRMKLLEQIRGDDRASVEYASGSDEGDTATEVAPAAMSAWVPSPAEHLRASMMLEELREALDPVDFGVAELFMAGMSHQGDRGEIANLVGVSPARISVATARIREVLRRLGYSP